MTRVTKEIYFVADNELRRTYKARRDDIGMMPSHELLCKLRGPVIEDRDMPVLHGSIFQILKVMDLVWQRPLPLRRGRSYPVG